MSITLRGTHSGCMHRQIYLFLRNPDISINLTEDLKEEVFILKDKGDTMDFLDMYIHCKDDDTLHMTQTANILRPR